jgi:hypothetical protein
MFLICVQKTRPESEHKIPSRVATISSAIDGTERALLNVQLNHDKMISK